MGYGSVCRVFIEKEVERENGGSVQKQRGDLAEKALEREREQVSGVACTSWWWWREWELEGINSPNFVGNISSS